jgi:hypothetical protein
LETVRLYRFRMSDQGAQGLWLTDGFSARSLELPWIGNRPNISCIPSGEYICQPHYSKKFGECYIITGVEGRSWILTHAGNLAGDRLKGYRTHSYGCILLGKYFGRLQGQLAVLVSRVTIRKFLSHMNKQPFTLKISDTWREAV